MTTSSQTIPDPGDSGEKRGSHPEASDEQLITIATVRRGLVSLTNQPGQWVGVNQVLDAVKRRHPHATLSTIVDRLHTLHDLGQVTFLKGNPRTVRIDTVIVIDPVSRTKSVLLNRDGYAIANLPGVLAPGIKQEGVR